MSGAFDMVHEDNDHAVVEDHIAEARRLLGAVPEASTEKSAYLAAAQVHASIATAKATLYAAQRINPPR